MSESSNQGILNSIPFAGRSLDFRIACLAAMLGLFFAGCEKPLKRKIMAAVDQNSTEIRNGVLYHLEHNDTINGYVKETAENGRVTYLYSVRKGKKEGSSLAWHENGCKSLQGHFRDGKEDGVWTTWRENGRKRWEGHRKNGVNHGSWTMWHESGNKKSEGVYENGLKEGEEIIWYQNGRVWQRRSYRKGKKEGHWTYWDKEGRLVKEEAYRDDELIDEKKLPDFWLRDKGS